MKSEFGDRFNHDDDAADYDNDVRNEEHPIRRGYDAAQRWLGGQVESGSRVLDLGSGTGNTILALPPDCRVTAVDNSERMLAIAREKLVGRKVTYVMADLLEFFEEGPYEPFDSVVSSYAVHHLTEEEKDLLFRLIRETLCSGGVAVFVDLMFENRTGRAELEERYRETHPGVVDDFDDEFFWDVRRATARLEAEGFTVKTVRFSDLSWGIRAELRS